MAVKINAYSRAKVVKKWIREDLGLSKKTSTRKIVKTMNTEIIIKRNVYKRKKILVKVFGESFYEKSMEKSIFAESNLYGEIIRIVKKKHLFESSKGVLRTMCNII